MNCYNHPHNPAVASCPDCHKGLCIDCSQKYSIPICSPCNQHRISQDKQYIIKDFIIIFLGGAVMTLIMNNTGTKNFPLSTNILMFYTYSGLIAGWRFLNRITPEYFLFLPIIGWLIYFMVKFMISGFVGIFILPYRVFMNIKRWRELKNIPL